MGINKRLTDLEEKVLMKPKSGTTKFCHWALPENEQLLLDRAYNIVQAHIPFSEATEVQKIILNEASELLTFRVADLFLTYLDTLLCRDDKIARITLHERFAWFICELRKEIEQQLKASEIEQNADPKSEVDEVDQYFRSVPEPFTEESYDQFTTEIALNHLKEKGELHE